MPELQLMFLLDLKCCSVFSYLISVRTGLHDCRLQSPLGWHRLDLQFTQLPRRCQGCQHQACQLPSKCRKSHSPGHVVLPAAL